MGRTSSVRRVAERLFLYVSRVVPVRLVAHLLHLLRQSPAITDRWGYHIRPIHYYDPVPDFRAIDTCRLEARRIPKGITFDVPTQAAKVRDLAARFGQEVRALDASGGFPFDNEYFAGVDAAVYYAMIRDLKPRRIVEIGAGYSTRMASRALEANLHEGHEGVLTVIEPYPQPRLTDGNMNMQLIAEPVEKVDPTFFEALAANDILFIDSSHVLRCGGDVFFEFLEILPRLRSGVHVHVHDIFFPFDYPADWILDRRLAFNEQYVLEAFLAFNSRFSPEVANLWLATDAPEATRELWNGTSGTRPSSFWMVRL